MLIAVGALTFLGLIGSPSGNARFDNSNGASSPSAWTLTATHLSVTPRWQIRKEASAPSRPNVLELESPNAQESETPLALFNGITCKDGDVSVKFLIEARSHQKAAGLVWRYQDSNNYYLLDFNADRRLVVVSHVHDGKLEPLPPLGAKPGEIGVQHDIRPGKWNIAKVVYRGNRFTVYFGNRRLMDVIDNSITAPGKAGLWVRGRTAAAFDDFRIDPKG